MVAKRKPVQKTQNRKPVAKKTVARTAAPARKAPVRKIPPAVVKRKGNSYQEDLKAMKALYPSHKVTLLDLPFRDLDATRMVRELGAEYIDRLKQFVYKGDVIPAPVKPYTSKDYSYSRWLEDDVNGKLKQTQLPAGGFYSLREHQQEGADDISKAAAKGWRGYVVADSTGLGKSLTGLMGVAQAAKQKGFTIINPAKLLIICPNNAIPHWRNTVRHVNIPWVRILVLNYDQYKKLLTVPAAAASAKKQATKNKHISTNGQPTIKWDYIICDEAHKVKNYTSQRTQGFEKIARYSAAAAAAPFVVWMSATLGQHPLELGFLSPLIGQAAKKHLTMENWPEWLNDNGFHVEKRGKTWQWIKPSGPNDIETREKQREDVRRLANILFNPKAPSMRRKPEDLAGWPEMNRIALPIELSPNSKAEYDRLWTEFRKSMSLKPHGKDPKGALSAQLRFAQKASYLRVNQTVEQIVELLENGYQPVVSFRFLESLEAVKASLRKLGLDASENSGRTFINNEHERILFQTGTNKVMLFTLEEAVSFHAKETLPDSSTASPFPRATLVHDLRYSALGMTQIIGRAHRDGQNANAYFLYSEGTVEEKILHIMLNKMENMSVLSGDEEEDVAVEILDRILV